MQPRVLQPIPLKRSLITVALVALSLACATGHPAPPLPAPSQAASAVAGAASVGGRVAVSAVFRVVCPTRHTFGTGFLHRSGRIITAAHVVAHCDPAALEIRGHGQRSSVSDIRMNRRTDVAILTPASKLSGIPLPISRRKAYPIGLQVTTWGFPEGYRGARPLLSVGYLSGAEIEPTRAGRVQRLVVNAAFNSGNSGGPVLDLQDHKVIGVVCSKLAPIPPQIEQALRALAHQRGGVVFRARRADGTIIALSEGQVVAEVLNYLRRQTQLVIGYAATAGDLRELLEANGVQP